MGSVSYKKGAPESGELDAIDRMILIAAATSPDRCLVQRKRRGAEDWDRRNARLEAAGLFVNLLRDVQESTDATDDYVISVWGITPAGHSLLRNGRQ